MKKVWELKIPHKEEPKSIRIFGLFEEDANEFSVWKNLYQSFYSEFGTLDGYVSGAEPSCEIAYNSMEEMPKELRNRLIKFKNSYKEFSSAHYSIPGMQNIPTTDIPVYTVQAHIPENLRIFNLERVYQSDHGTYRFSRNAEGQFFRTDIGRDGLATIAPVDAEDIIREQREYDRRQRLATARETRRTIAGPVFTMDWA